MRWDLMLATRCILDVFLAAFLFSALPCQYKKPRPFARFAAAACLCALIPMYNLVLLLSNFVRLVYRVSLYTLYIRLAKGLPWKRCLYVALYVWLIFHLCTNVFLTPFFRHSFFLFELSEFTPATAVLLTIYVAVFLLFRRSVVFAPDHEPGKVHFIFVLILCFAQIYIKRTLNTISSSVYQGPAELNIYLILLQILLGVFMLVFENYLYSQKIREQEHIAALTSRYRYENLKSQQQAQDDLRRIHHDMKNHLLAIRSLAADNQRLDGYIDTLMAGLTEYDIRPDTGSDLLDSLLADKMRTAQEKGIPFQVDLDLRPCIPIEDIDLCTIFGNLADNAIEASAKVNDTQMRAILFKSHPSANQFSIRCSNYYAGELVIANGLPRTTKADRSSHGIGLTSIKRSVEKYGGVLSIQVLPEHRVIFTLLLPLKVSSV